MIKSAMKIIPLALIYDPLASLAELADAG